MRLQGIQTRSDFKNQSNDCGCSACCKSKKEKSGSESEKKKMISEHDGLPLLDEIAVTVIARIVVNKIKEVCVPKRGNCKRCADRYCLCRRDVEDDTILTVDSASNQDNTVKIAEKVREKLLKDGSAYVLRQLPNDAKSSVSVQIDTRRSPDVGRPLLLSSAATVAAGGVVVQPDHKSGEPSVELSATSANSGDALIRGSNDGSRSPSAPGVLLFSGGVPGGNDGTTRLEMTNLGSAVDARGSRSGTPPPLSGAPSITSTPPSPPAVEDVPPPPMASI
jgi:hypothetical protein